MPSSPSDASSALLPIPAAALFQAFKTGEVLWGEYYGEPLVAVYDPITKSGGAAQINGVRMEADFARWLDAVRRAYPASSMPGLQIKFISNKGDESRLRMLAKKARIIPMSFASFNHDERLECFFYTETGRLRIAPSEKSSPHVPVLAPAHPDSGSRRTTKVFIVDDSATIRRLLRKIFDACPDLEVVGEAERPSQVEALLDTLQPDVMTLDINMPEMSGVELLKNTLKRRFIPTVMISSLNIDEGKEVLDALELGAVDYIHKPSANELAALTPIIHEKILAAAKVRRKNAGSRANASRPAPSISGKSFAQTSVLAVGASTGGTEAIKRIFLALPREIPPIVVVQHIPPYFSTAFANRLNEVCKFEVREAKDGDTLKPGLALIAPGGMHLEVIREGKDLIARVFDGEPVNRFKPAVDVLFNSVAKSVGRRAAGVLLTGMGADGAKGLLAMKNAGAFTICQDEESCVVFGMPRAAIEMGAACLVSPLDGIPAALSGEKAA